MAEIHLLDESLINKIAAGEVVERPASVVKELVENAIDAGATSIRIELEDGGRKLIAITDDGKGMNADDALLCVKRHATSKIRDLDDLFDIHTMGFRGEALAAIAAVSRLTVTTQPEGQEGSRVSLANGEGVRQPWTGPRGTTITVEHLFDNVPARKNFLKKPTIEYAHCLELVRNLALSLPHIEFTCFHNGKRQLHAPAIIHSDGARSGAGAKTLLGEDAIRGRAEAVFGKNDITPLRYFQKATAHGTVEGLLSLPGNERSQSKFLFGFVNQRAVKDKALRYGILRGYHSHLLRGKYPYVILYLTLDPALVDVNVHPAKAEVRFQYPQEVQDLIAIALRDTLRDAPPAVLPQVSASPYFREPTSKEVTAVPGHSHPPIPRDFDLGFSPGSGREASSTFQSRFSPSLRSEASKTVTYRTEHFPLRDPGDASEPLSKTESAPANFPVDATYLGTFGACYLFFEHEGRLLVVDQHAFHERVLYERLCAKSALLTETQPLLMPEVVALTPTQTALLGENAEGIKALGLSIKPVSETEVEVLAVPSILGHRDVGDLLGVLADKLENNGDVSASTLHHDLLATMACHSAVRAGELLSDEDRVSLMREALTVDFFQNCPHGRRVLRWFELAEVAGWFDR